MSEEAKKPTHYRLVTALKAIGPYLREPLCKEGAYHFDCLSVCVDDSKSPEDREFWRLVVRFIYRRRKIRSYVSDRPL